MSDRRSIRLKGYDYSKSGWYFVTIDVQDKLKLFGIIVKGKMILNKYGKILDEEIINTQKIRNGVLIPTYQIMPDHLHMILNISVGAHGNTPVQSGIGMAVGVHGSYFVFPSGGNGDMIGYDFKLAGENKSDYRKLD